MSPGPGRHGRLRGVQPGLSEHGMGGGKEGHEKMDGYILFLFRL